MTDERSLTLLTTAEAAARLNVSFHTLVDWRRPGATGPDLPWLQIGRRVFYRGDDVAKMLRRRSRPVRFLVPGLPEHAACAA